MFGPLSRAFILIALLGIVQLHYLYMPVKLKLGNDRSLQLRSRLAKDLEDDRGIYAIGEVALVRDVNSNDYVTAGGLAFRNDDIPVDQIVEHNKAREAREAKEKADKSDD